MFGVSIISNFELVMKAPQIGHCYLKCSQIRRPVWNLPRIIPFITNLNPTQIGKILKEDVIIAPITIENSIFEKIVKGNKMLL